MSAVEKIGVIGGEDGDDCLEVLGALADSCGLGLRRAQLEEASDLAGLIVLGTINKKAVGQASKDRPCLRVIMTEASIPKATVRFGTGHAAPFPFRGRSLLTGSVVPGDPQGLSGEIIATADGKPVWTTVSEGEGRDDTCWVPRPWVKRGDCVFDHLNAGRFMNLLPVIEWLRSISQWREWIQPPLSACFMFDDPNLHATHYGYLRFRELAVEGKREHYHTALATVPLDAYYINDDAARIIRENHESLSLLIHGNNHTYREMAGHLPLAPQSALMRQALFRIARLEQKAGVAVSRVMAPPHGVCSAEEMAAMVEVGFEAACVSHGAVRAGNAGMGWTVLLGALPATVIVGLPVIPRFGLDRGPENSILLAAYLNQPIILVGHHWNLAGGTDILSSVASFINGLGRVTWSDMTAITRRNYSFRLCGRMMRVRAFSRIATVGVPEGVGELAFEASWLDPSRETVECRGLVTAPQEAPQILDSRGLRFRVSPGSTCELAVVRPRHGGVHPPPLPKTPPSAVARRVLVEIRDRCMPLVPRRFAKR